MWISGLIAAIASNSGPTATDGVAWPVCLSVRLSVC